jgi:hypothetical protein
VAKGNPDGTNLSFSQAQGLEPLPKPLALGDISLHFRTDVWNWLYTKIKGSEARNSFRITGIWRSAFVLIHTTFFHLGLDIFDDDTRSLCPLYKGALIGKDELRWNIIFDLIQFILRLGPLAQDQRMLHAQMRHIFQKNLLAYDIIDVPPAGATIVPTASPEEGDAVRGAFTALAQSPFSGARVHLRSAGEAINANEAAAAIRESVHAVESVVRLIAPNKNFRDALTAIDSKASIHPALRDALNRLYGYTSDEKGIRHPLLESDTARVGMSEAIFMFGTCASFITYLISRGRQSGMLNS